MTLRVTRTFKLDPGVYFEIPSVKRIFTEVKVFPGVIFDEEFNGDLEFDLEHDLQGHFKVKLIFLNRNPFLSPAIERAKNFTFR